MKTAVLAGLAALLISLSALISSVTLQKVQPTFAGSANPSFHNQTSTLVNSSATCGTTSSIAIGPMNGVLFLRVTNDSTGSVYIGLVPTSSINGFITAHTGLLLAAATSGGMYYWDTGEDAVAIPDGSYLDCVGIASGSVITYSSYR